MEIHQSLTKSKTGVRNVLCRHEQGEVFAAEGYAKCTGKVGVCIATSGPGATNLVTGLADALLDSVPMVAITGQVPRRMIGTDAFQETPTVEITRQITKHNYLVMDVNDIPRIVREAFFLASSGRPGPVLIDIPKDVQQQMSIPYWGPKVSLNGYLSRLPSPPSHPQMERVLDMIKDAKRPVVYAGGGCLDAAPELKEFIESTGIPITNTLMGLGCYPASDELCLDMLGMHGAVYANYAVDSADLLLAFGVRFDDRVTGKLEAFAARASIVHIDIDPAEIGKNKEAHCPVFSNIKPALRTLNSIIRADKPELDFSEWRADIAKQRAKFPFAYTETDDYIVPQHAVELLCEMTQGKAVVSTGVGQHQMWAAQHYKFDEPRNWLTSGGLGSMGFGLPAAIGAAAARPDAVVVDIDGDGSFVMNIQELATLHAENLPVKMFVLNNQHLGMVGSEDRFYGSNRGHVPAPRTWSTTRRRTRRTSSRFREDLRGVPRPGGARGAKGGSETRHPAAARPRRALPPRRHVPAPGTCPAHGPGRGTFKIPSPPETEDPGAQGHEDAVGERDEARELKRNAEMYGISQFDDFEPTNAMELIPHILTRLASIELRDHYSDRRFDSRRARSGTASVKTMAGDVASRRRDGGSARDARASLRSRTSPRCRRSSRS